MAGHSNLSERRLVLRLLAYWREVCRDRQWPSPNDFYPAAIPDLWEYCFLIDLSSIATGGEPMFSYVGSYHRRMLDRDLVGTAVSQAGQDTLLAHASSSLPDVVKRAVPITFGGQFADNSGCNVLFRSILLPLSADDKTVSAILGSANCRQTPPGEATPGEPG